MIALCVGVAVGGSSGYNDDTAAQPAPTQTVTTQVTVTPAPVTVTTTTTAPAPRRTIPQSCLDYVAKSTEIVDAGSEFLAAYNNFYALLNDGQRFLTLNDIPNLNYVREQMKDAQLAAAEATNNMLSAEDTQASYRTLCDKDLEK